MLGEVAALAKSFAATREFAGERFEAGVGAHMDAKCSRCGEGFMADAAVKRLLSSMSSLMLFEHCFFGARIVAVEALVRTVAGVYYDVSRDLLSLREGSMAAIAVLPVAYVLLLSRSHVFLCNVLGKICC